MTSSSSVLSLGGSTVAALLEIKRGGAPVSVQVQINQSIGIYIMTKRKIGQLVSLLAIVVGSNASTTCATPETSAPEPLPGKNLDVRVLLVARGSATADPGRFVMEQLFNTVGVAYEVFDSSAEALTESMLYTGPEHGRFNGIILTDAETYVAGGEGLTQAEFEMLHAYEREFGVREAVMSGWPSSTSKADYGMQNILGLSNPSGRWVGAAGGTESFEYVNIENSLPADGWAIMAQPRQGAAIGPVVEPLLVDEAQPDYAFISRLRYEDGRDVLLSTLPQAWFLTHTNVLAYEFLNFATSGLFVGARKAYLAAHNDDLFLPDEVWNPETLSNFDESVYNFRISAEEISAAVDAQRGFRERHPTASGFMTDWAYNGVGADPVNDPLSLAITEHASEFGFINHTFMALQMDHLCPSEESAEGCVRTDYTTAYNEIMDNATMWSQLGIPNPANALVALLSDSHSGLSDRRGTPSTADDIPFPEGFNHDFGRAAEDLGIRMLAGDMSRANQDRIQRVPGHELVLLPRYPTAVFYNTTTPQELTSEYNYIHNQRYIDLGQDPCAIPSAICTPRDYNQILDSEAKSATRHILSYEPFPHYFHQVNLHVYDDAGSSLQFDWLERVVTAYERNIKLPLVNLRFHELGELAWRRVQREEISHSAVLNLDTNSVTVYADAPVELELTGVGGGEMYGGQSIRMVSASPEPQALGLDPAFER